MIGTIRETVPTTTPKHERDGKWEVLDCVNDPSAGSPTETLLRLLLPLSDKVYLTSHILARDQIAVQKVHRITQNR